MFGRDNENTSKTTNDIPDNSVHGVLDSEAAEADQSNDQPTSPTPSVTSDDQPASSDDNKDWQHPGTPLNSSPGYISDVTNPDGHHTATVQTPHTPSRTVVAPDDKPTDTTDNTASGEITHELIDIKQQALGQLSPLLSHLDQSPEDKFRTLLMMIQASDDQSLVKSAYEAANAITDEKTRAQALLDIVNEINYFTTQHQSPQG